MADRFCPDSWSPDNNPLYMSPEEVEVRAGGRRRHRWLRLLGLRLATVTGSPSLFRFGQVSIGGRAVLILRAGTFPILDDVEDPAQPPGAILFPPSSTRHFTFRDTTLWEVWTWPHLYPRPLRRLTLIELEMTADFCPSEWDARTTDGQEVYVRYRHGVLRVYLGGLDGKLAHIAEIGDPFDGSMTTKQMLAYTGLRLAPGAKVKERRD